MAETGTIAGIVSAVAMALVGAVSSYISYQKKKFCFSIQRKNEQLALSCQINGCFRLFWRTSPSPFFFTESLNADMVKAENPEAVVAQEPQGRARVAFIFPPSIVKDGLNRLIRNVSLTEYYRTTKST